MINRFFHLRPWQGHNRPTILYILFYLFGVSVSIPLSLSPAFLFPLVTPFNCNHPQSFIKSLFQLLISKLTQFLRLHIFEFLIFLLSPILHFPSPPQFLSHQSYLPAPVHIVIKPVIPSFIPFTFPSTLCPHQTQSLTQPFLFLTHSLHS